MSNLLLFELLLVGIVLNCIGQMPSANAQMSRFQVATIDREPAESVQQPKPQVMMNYDGIGHLHPHHPNRDPEVMCPSCLDARLIQHYTIKGCTPVVLGQCKCPSRFKCPVDMPPRMNRNKGRVIGFGSHSSSSSAPEGRSMKLTAEGDLAVEGCKYNGSTFDLGQIVRTRDVCRICVCGYLSDGTIGVDCETQIQCPAVRSTSPQNTWMTNQAGQLVSTFLGRSVGQMNNPIRLSCYDFYEHDKCCPRQECVPINVRTGRTLKPRKSCRYNKKSYQLGEIIDLQSIIRTSSLLESLDEDTSLEPSSEENNLDLLNNTEENFQSIPSLRKSQFPENFPEEIACLNCICTEGWNSTLLELAGRDRLSMDFFLEEMGQSCRRKTCEMQLDPRFKAGCLPVYHEDQCCPVDFVCPRTRYMSMRVRGLDSGSKLCKFEGRKYAVGARLYQMDHAAAPCVDCECRVPPEFTCLQRKNCISGGGEGENGSGSQVLGRKRQINS